MPLRMPARLTLLTLALLVLLPALAVLQYKWVGQLSEAERERMQRNLRHAAMQFREAFDGGLARALIGLSVDGAIARDAAWDRYAERYAAWAATAEHPALVAGVFVVNAHRGEVRLRRWNAAARAFERVEWAGAVAAARPEFTRALEGAEGARGAAPLRGAPLGEHPSLLVLPLVHLEAGADHSTVRSSRVSGFTVLELDMRYVRETLLPSLVRRHFPQGGDVAYHVAVIDASSPATVIFRSSPDAPLDPARADTVEPFFGAHRDPLMLVARGGATPESRETRNIVVSVIRERGDGAVTRARFIEGPGGRWQLLVQDARGSLDAAVAGLRRRNLAISFGILLLMGVTIATLSLSSRRAQRLARQQMEFVAGVSHELRTPVAVIRSAAENLAHGVVDDAGRVRRYGDAIGVEARRLGEMVERVLEYAGIEAGHALPASAVALAPLIDEAVHAAGARDGDAYIVERDVAPDLPPVAGDAAALRSAIQNLVANAMKYGGADRWIGIKAETASSRRGREVRVTVGDHGRGIAAGDLPHIFEPFYRGAEQIERQVQGSGLGLALVRRIAEAHGGRVTVVTREGAGTAFTLHLRALQPNADAAESKITFYPSDEAVAR